MPQNLEALSEALLLDGWEPLDTARDSMPRGLPVVTVWGAWHKHGVELTVYGARKSRRKNQPPSDVLGCFVEISMGNRGLVFTYPSNSVIVAITASEALESTQKELLKLCTILPKLASDLEKRFAPDDTGLPRRGPGRPKGSRNRPKPAVDHTEKWFGVIRSGS